MSSFDPSDPPGIDFYDQASKRMMRLVQEGGYAGWIVFRHPVAGNWVTLRKATKDDRAAVAAATPRKRFCLRLDPELWDGEHQGIMPMHDVGTDPASIEDAAWLRFTATVRNWVDCANPGDEVTISVVHMTQDEIDALPEC